jgi:hypothetical protein
MNAHILVFKCPNCGRPILHVRLDEANTYPDSYTDTDTTPVQCLGADCEWTSRVLVSTYEKKWTIDWPYLKRVGGR